MFATRGQERGNWKLLGPKWLFWNKSSCKFFKYYCIKQSDIRSIGYSRVNTSSLNTSCEAAPVHDGVRPSVACWHLCCLIWFREGRDWLTAATVSLVQSSTSLWRSSVNVPLLLLLLLVCTRASCVIGCGDGEDITGVGWVWLVVVWAPVVLREDPETHRCVKILFS